MNKIASIRALDNVNSRFKVAAGPITLKVAIAELLADACLKTLQEVRVASR